MSRQVFHDGQGALRIRFSFDRRLVDLVKTLPNRRWNAVEKYWWVPEGDVVPLVDLLGPEGFDLDEATRSLYLGQGGTRAIESPARSAAGPAPPGLFEAAADGGDPLPAAGPSRGAADDYTVSRLNLEAKRALAAVFPAPVWLVGEISGFNKSAHRRIVGFHLVERDPAGRSVAEVNSVLFDEARQEIEARLAAAGGPFRLEDEVTVRVRGSVELYEPWGQFRFRVVEIDIGYTLGEAARRREEIVRRLTALGVLGLNTSLPFPVLPLRVGLVTSLGSDAFNDVVRTLQESGFAFRVTVHGARVQGRSTEPSVLNALDWFRRRLAEFDVVMICRGGGSRTDLAWFDSEPLGRAVAAFPLPVLIGIGHEQDQSVLDFVGWRSKTPTAAAARLVDRVRETEERIEAAARAILGGAADVTREEAQALADRTRRLAHAARGLLEREATELAHVRMRAVRATRSLLAAALGDVARRAAALPRAALLLLERRRMMLAQSGRQVVQGARRDLAAAARTVTELAAALGPRGLRRLGLEAERTDGRARRLHLVDPRRVVERGYAILRVAAGGVLTEAAAAPAGTSVLAELKRGRLTLRSLGSEAEEGGG
ncbi:MAG: exodeoxyribonuclease VII large subunit [Acidobacteriia bacterium]|nr:exodeoxyribonuclease VII large subunit [Terriglobia bacterium]